MGKFILLLTSWLVCCGISAQQRPTSDLYQTGHWDADSLGNHRVVLQVSKKADAVLASINWRRRDYNPEKKDLYIIDAATGKRISNVERFTINREKGDIVFQPQTVPGTYYVYYLKNHTEGRNYPVVTYPPFVSTAEQDWITRNHLNKKSISKLSKAEVVAFESINQFNSFYPMEVIATSVEKKQLLKDLNAGEVGQIEKGENTYMLFPEDRKYPIRMTNDLPYRWIENNDYTSFKGDAQRGEYYVFQLGLWAAQKEIQDVSLVFSNLIEPKSKAIIPAAAFTCFNTEGTDVSGMSFKKHILVKQGKIQPLWIGIDVPTKLPAGTYEGEVSVKTKNAETRTIKVALEVSSKLLADRGDGEPWRHSRLRWLNSQIGRDDEVIAPYTPLEKEGHILKCLGRTVELTSTGFPKQITSYFKEALTEIGKEGKPILQKPIEIKAGGDWENLSFSYTNIKSGVIAWKALNRNDSFLMDLEAKMEADGNIEYKVTLAALKEGMINDISLETELNAGITRYMMGLGQKGGYCPQHFDWKWDVEKNQDGCWLGDVNAGLQIRLFDNKYERPLNTNFYHKKPLHMPTSWSNSGKGGINFVVNPTGTDWKAYSGERTFKKGENLYYYFNLAITPFRCINTDKQWKDRYYHSYDFIDKAQKYGANVVNIHHANAINPFINYPFLRTREMKAYIDGAHARDMKVKIYNTVRELSNSCVELFALRSLGDELFSQGEGGGYSWLQEHLDQDYIAAWFVPSLKDAAIVNSGVSRWHNYYLEGLDWLVKNIGIDGLYIDDLAFDRETMKRVRKILNRTNSESMIDLHSANQFNPKDGFANSANLYLEHFPYLDRLWFGEYFDYNLPPDFWLIEVSGIPYGLMGEMLWDGGNRWRGMLYGITGRSPGISDNRPLWKAWDDFGMTGSEMIGYWVEDNPVKTGKPLTPATVYSHKGQKSMIALATWEKEDAAVQLDIDWEQLGLDPATVVLHAPAIEDYQTEATYQVEDVITVPKGKGLLLIIEKK